MPTDNLCFYLQKSLIQTGGQQYSDTSPFSIACLCFSVQNKLIRFQACLNLFIGIITTIVVFVLENFDDAELKQVPKPYNFFPKESLLKGKKAQYGWPPCTN